VRRRWSLRHKCQLEVIDDTVDHGIVGEEGDDAHLAAALRAEHRVNLIDLPDHLGPAFGGEGTELLLHHSERNRHQARLLDLPPMGVPVEAVISDRDLALVGNMGSHPGDELQVIHALGLFSLFPILVADPAFPFIEGEALQGEQRPDHVFADPFGLCLCPGPDPAVDIETRMPPGE